MIVIATHDGNETAFNLIDSILRHDGDEIVLLVDTGSVQPLEDLRRKVAGKYGGRILVDKSPGANYETGAYLHAFRNYYDHEYLFLQDSLAAVCNNFMDLFRSWSCIYGQCIVPWMGVSPIRRGINDEVEFEIRKALDGIDPFSDAPAFFPFVNIFYVKRSSLETMVSRGYCRYMPTNKRGSEATERLWGL